MLTKEFTESTIRSTNTNSVTSRQLLLARKDLAEEVEVLVDKGFRTIRSNSVNKLPAIMLIRLISNATDPFVKTTYFKYASQLSVF
jgi:hypothetical protein